MPPKRKKGKGKGKGAKKGKRKGKGGKKAKKEEKELTAKDMFLRSHKENARLREELASHVEVSRRAKTSMTSLRVEMDGTRDHLEQEKTDKRDIISDLTRQYKSIQMQLGMRMQQLEGQVHRLQQDLGQTKLELTEMTAQKEHYQRRTEDLQEQLRTIVQTLEGSYETILMDTMDSMTHRMDELRLGWSEDAIATDHRLTQLYSEFGGRYIAGKPAKKSLLAESDDRGTGLRFSL